MVEISDITGSFGNYQWTVVLFGSAIGVISPAVALVTAFVFPNVDHWCRKPTYLTNLTSNQWKTVGIPINHATSKYEQCHQYAVVRTPDGNYSINRNVIVECHQWDYDPSEFWPSGTEQWNLVCNNSWMLPFPQGTFFAGSLIGHFCFGYFADKYGRRPVIEINVTLSSLFLCIRPFISTFWIFNVFSFCSGLMAGTLVTTMGLFLEVTSANYRCLSMVIFSIAWGFGFFLLAGAAAMIPDWHYMLLVFGMMYAACIPILWNIYESPRWLLSTGQIQSATDTIRQIAHVNKTYEEKTFNKLMPQLSKNYDEEMLMKKEAKPIDLINTVKLRTYTASSVAFVFFLSPVYFDVSLKTDSFPVSPYMNFVISGVIEIAAGAASIAVLRYLPRKITTISVNIGPALMYILYIFISGRYTRLTSALLIICRFCIALMCDFGFVYSGEIFPTGLRALALGIISISGQAGGSIQPYVSPYLDENVGKPLAYACCLLICAMMALLWPETYKRELPDFVE